MDHHDIAATPYLIGPVEFERQDERRLVLATANGGELEVSAWAPDVVRVRYIPSTRPPATIGWALTSPEGSPESFPVEITFGGEAWALSTPRLTARVDRRTGAVAVDAAGHPSPIAEDDPAGPIREEPLAGLPGTDTGTHPVRIRAAKRLPPGAMCLGLGEKAGWMDRRGRVLEMWNTDVLPHLPDTDPLYQSIPFVIVYERGRAWGLFLHNTHRTVFDLGSGQPDRLEFSADAGQLDYFVLAGPTLPQVVSRFSDLTGRMPLPPRWALGFQQSRWGYMTADEVREVASELRRRAIPCDVIYLDIDYMDGYRVFTWDPARFPDPQALLEELRSHGFRVVTIVDPGVKIDEGYPVYLEGLESGLFCRRADGDRPFEGKVWPGPTVWPDFIRAETRRWWGRWHRVLLDAGVSGIWNDMNEPANFRHPLPTGTLDPGVRHGPDAERPAEERRELLHTEAHNVYGLLMSKAAYEAQLALRPGVRPFVLSRSGFAGIQRYAAVWTGDNSSWWEHLAMMVPQLINLGLSGVAFAGADTGGFAGHATGELLARWTQAGAFTPFFRNHSAMNTRRQEVWQFGEHIEAICRRAIEWRYRLLPYLYVLFWEAASNGTPVMRPLFWHFPGDASAERLQDEWLLGAHLLVAPVTQPGARHRTVYLPEGEWVHLWRPLRLLGPTHTAVEAELWELPVFVRAGAPLLLGPVPAHTGELARDGRVSVWMAAPSAAYLEPSGQDFWTWLYEDDGESLAYQSGEFARRRFDAAWSDGSGKLRLQLSFSGRDGRFRPAREWLEVVIDRVWHVPTWVSWQGAELSPTGEPLRPVFEDQANPAAASESRWSAQPAWYHDAAAGRVIVRVPERPEPGELLVEW